MTCRLDHVSLASRDPGRAAARMAGTFGHWRGHGTALHSSHDVALVPRAIGDHDNRPGIAELVFTASDLESMRRRLAGYDLSPLPNTEYGLLYRDPHGLLFRVAEQGETLKASVPASSSLRLAHVDVLVPDLARQRTFYEQALGLVTISEYVDDDGTFVYLADQDYRRGGHDFLIEVVGPPNLEPREQQILAEIGPSYDHICYETLDVRGAYRDLVALGYIGHIPPYDAYGGTLAWLRDLEGLDIELIRPISHDGFAAAVAGGPPVRRTGACATAAHLR